MSHNNESSKNSTISKFMKKEDFEDEYSGINMKKTKNLKTKTLITDDGNF